VKNFLLIFLSLVAVGELITLGIINFQKSPQKTQQARTASSSSQTINPKPQEVAVLSASDYLASITTATPSGTQVGSITLTPTISISPKPTSTATPNIPASSTPSHTPSPSASPTVSPSPTPASSPSVSPSATPTATVIARITYSSQEINSFVDKFAGQYGVDANSIRHIALCESGFRADAVNGPYGGLFQFHSNTWLSWRKKMGEDGNADLRFNAEEAVQTAAYVLKNNSVGIWPNCKP
jgi:hypothetical protein